MTLATSSSDMAAPECHFLATPPEIRNRIYELVFQDAPSTADLLTAAPPSKALVTACRQIHHETRQMYQAAYRAYWSETAFSITLTNDRENTEQVYDHVLQLDDGDVAHITKVTLDAPRTSWTLTDGLWFRPDVCLPPARDWVFVIPKAKLENVRSAGLPMLISVFGTGGARRFWTQGPEADANEVEQLKKLIQKDGLSKEELFVWVGVLTRHSSA